MPTFTLPRLQLPRTMPRFDGVDLTRFDLPNLNLLNLNLPNLNLPNLNLPEVDLPDVELPSLERVGEVAREAAYAGVGLVALSVERIGERVRDLQDAVASQTRRVRDTIA